MTNIWGFLLQTISISLVIFLLLFIKYIFKDKLSARFQYLVWSVLALRIVIPASITRTNLVPFSLTLEALKGFSEKSLASAYSARFESISLSSVFPVITEKPESITDIFFCVYAAGILLYLLFYLVSYLRLRVLLLRADRVSAEEQARVDAVAKTYSLKSCRAVWVSGISSAFVCGIIRPLLVLPKEKETDEKILLHELLHLKYKDALQNVVWCLLRALHWCNPLVHIAMRRIGNDMESLCDARVLERLEGEERREYGKILLDMANTKYARAPFTSSISNGGRQITRRIEAIVRFKKFPKGMMTAAVCITLFLCFPTLVGTKAVYTDAYYPGGYASLSAWEKEITLAVVRLNRPTTVAGALDTYAKGIMYENGYYVTTASPASAHEEMSAHVEEPVKWPKANIRKYTVANLCEIEKDRYEALLLFSTQLYEKETNTWYTVLSIPVSLQYENGGWSVTENGERVFYPFNADIHTSFYFSEETDDYAYPYTAREEYQTKTGRLIIEHRASYIIEAEYEEIFPGFGSYSSALNTNAAFSAKTDHALWIYLYDDTCDLRPKESITIVKKYLDSPTERYRFTEDSIQTGGNTNWSIGYSEHGSSNPVREKFEGYIKDMSYMRFDDMNDAPAQNAAVRIYFDGELVEEFIITEDGHVHQIK